MCEVTKINFKEKFADIKNSLRNAKFIAVDLEFSALEPVHAARLFDSNKERYAKLRMNLLHVVPLQIGLTAFQFDNKTDDYVGEVFSFYVSPPSFGDLNKTYYVQASSTQFLCFHNFDFNKCAYSGIPYLNDEEERILRQKLRSEDLFGEMCHMNHDFNDIIKMQVPIVAKWYNQSKVGDFHEIPGIKRYAHFYEIVYFLHKHLRKRFENLWTYSQDGTFCVKKVSSEELQQLLKTCTLDDDVLSDLMGFKHVFNLLTTLRKPIVGHNVLQDIMIMINNFHMPLPDSYLQFKALTNQLFPTIFDTKTLYYELRPTIPKEKLPKEVSLKGLFRYFKDGLGRHLVMDTTAIDCSLDQTKIDSYHDAGWDSYCTGYIFLRLAHFNISKHFPKGKTFVSSEVIGGLAQYKNSVNVIRGATSYLKLDGEDPTSSRPPWLIVESVKNEPLDVPDLMSTLSSYGFVDIKKFSSNGKRILVAVDTYRAAREISKKFRTNQQIQVRQYNVLRHSPVAQAALLGALTISGSILLWLTHTLVKR